MTYWDKEKKLVLGNMIEDGRLEKDALRAQFPEKTIGAIKQQIVKLGIKIPKKEKRILPMKNNQGEKVSATGLLVALAETIKRLEALKNIL